MPKKLKSVNTPDTYKQKNITDYFKNTVPVVNRKLFIGESAGSKMPFHKEKIIDNNSDDDFCDLLSSKVILPFPLISDDEEDSGPNNGKNKKKKLIKKRKESLLAEELKSQPIETKTMIKLNKPSPSNSKQKSISMTPSRPSKKNPTNVKILENIRSPKRTHEYAFEETKSTSNNNNRKTNQKRTEQGELKLGEKLENQIEDVETSTTTDSNKPSPSNSKQELIPMASSLRTKTDIGVDGSVILGDETKTNESKVENIRLTSKKSHESAFGNEVPYVEETLETPVKRAFVDSTSQISPLKLHSDEGIGTAGDSVQDSPVSQDKRDSMKFIIKEDSTPSKRKIVSFTTSSSLSPSKKTPTKNKIGSPKVSPTRRRTPRTPGHIKRKVTFGSSTILKQDGEEEKLNLTQLELLKNLFQETLDCKDKRKLLTEADIEVVEEFLKLDVNHQYFLIKLFLYLPKWYNIVKFCSNIKLDQKLSLKEITSMYEFYKSSKFVDTDLTQLSIDELLDLLMLGDLKQIAMDFKLATKNHGTKPKLTEYLKRNCKTQTTLTMKKSSEDVLKDAARKHLGHCIKLKGDTRSSFYKVYVLQTCSNFSYCIDVQNYFKEVGYDKVVYPNYTMENYTPFSNKEQFLRFYEAVGMVKDVNHALENKSYIIAKNLCDEVFKMLQSVDDYGKWKRHLPDYLHKFSAEYRYISVLKSGIVKLTTKYFEDVKCWLEFLIKHYPTNHAIGFWYKQLAHINVHYLKNYESAAEIVVEAFEFNKKQNVFNLLQIYELNKLANKIRTTKTYKVCVLNCDRLAALSELPVDTSNFVQKFIKGCTDRSGTPGKRIYSYRDSNNEVTYGSVENITLRYYSDNEEYEGIHCEGKFMVILFTLLFWDIIYEYYVPRTFISKLQSAPLDMYSDSFYKNRKGEIDSRLEEIASKWPEQKLEKIIEDNWNNHSNEKSITDFESFNKELNDVLIMIHCIDRVVLSKILGRLVSNYKRFRSGLPDLFLWNSKLSKSKFVEVKGENDCLHPNQILWIRHLIEVGAEVEVCHVSGVGAKKIMTEDN